MKKIILFLFIISSSAAFAQPFGKLISSKDSVLSFNVIAEKINRFFDTARGQNRAGYKQWKREEWYAGNHLSANGKLENYIEKNLAASDALLSMWPKSNQTNSIESNAGAWLNTGYVDATNTGGVASQGRINCFAFDPNNANIIYAGAAGGGIWKTLNGGLSWFSISDNLPVLGISGLAVAPDGNTIYALSGEGISVNVYLHKGVGVLKSTDAGNTWQRTGLSNSLINQRGGYKIKIHPSNSNIILAAMSNGLWKSGDAGNSWLPLDTGYAITDFEFKPNNADTIYYAYDNAAFIMKRNINTGASTFKSISTAVPVTRLEIGVSAADPEGVYVLAGPSWSTDPNPNTCYNGSPRYNGLFYSNNNGPFTLRNNNIDVFNMCGDQSDYDIVMYVDPNASNTVIIGGVYIWRSTDGGATFSLLSETNLLHADHHALERNPLDGSLWLGNDGGICRSNNNGINWTTLSYNLVVNEFYRISGYQGIPDLLLGGTQDNGVFLRNNNSNVFSRVLGSDGMDNLIDFTNLNIMYANLQGGDLYKSINGGNSFVNIPTPSRGPWITSILQLPDVNAPNTIFYGSNAGVLRSANGGTNWTNINGPAPAYAMGIGKTGSNVKLYALANGNQVWLCSNPADLSPSWVLRNSPTSAGITSFAVNPSNNNDVWITCAGYTAGQKVYRSFDAGGTWVNYSFSLPNIPFYSIVFANNINNPSGAVYVGSELGVFYTEDQFPDWVPFYNGLPMVPVTDLEINYSGNRLYAATYGRGIWQTDLYSGCLPSLFLSGISNGNKFYEASGFIETTQQVSYGAGNELRLRAGQKITFKPGYRSNYGSYLHAVIGNCGSGVPAKANR